MTAAGQPHLHQLGHTCESDVAPTLAWQRPTPDGAVACPDLAGLGVARLASVVDQPGLHLSPALLVAGHTLPPAVSFQQCLDAPVPPLSPSWLPGAACIEGSGEPLASELLLSARHASVAKRKGSQDGTHVAFIHVSFLFLQPL